VPTLQQAQQLKEFTEEVFELSKDVWAAQSRSRTKDQTEITETEFLTLDLLTKQQPLTVGDIQRQIGVLPAQMSRVIRSLESKGEESLITCRINPQDKRKVDVELTPAGVKAHQTYRQLKLGSIERMLLALTEHDREELMRILRLVGQQARKGLENK
jgi:MarR family transcriptional regulator, organic hydroperoxide resistance regulator